MRNGPIVGGMTHGTYDPWKDPTGAIGLALAEARWQEERYEEIAESGNGRIPDTTQARKKGIDYNVFGREVESNPVRLNAFEDTDTKRDILFRSGVTHLKVKGGRVPVYEASNARAGQAFSNIYRQYMKRR